MQSSHVVLPAMRAQGCSVKRCSQASKKMGAGGTAAERAARIGGRYAFAAAVVAAILGAGLSALFTNWFGLANAVGPGTATTRGTQTVINDPALVNVIHEGAQQQPANGAFAFPQALKLTATELATINKSGLTAWAVPRGGYDVGESLIKVTITALTHVHIVGMKALVLSSRRPIDGTFFGIAGQGFVPNTALDISLSSPSPVALAVGSDGLPTRQPYFDKYSYDLSDGQSETFQITAYTTLQLYGLTPRTAVRWDLLVTLLSDGKLHNIVVKDAGGIPFATTGSAVVNGGDFTGSYDSAYEQCIYADVKFAPCKTLPNYTWVRAK